MKTHIITLMLIASITAGYGKEPTLEEIQQELTLTKARLELAEAKLSLAAKEQELAKLTGTKPRGEATTEEPKKKEEKPATAEVAAKELWKLGVEHLQELRPLQRQSMLGANGITPEQWNHMVNKPVKSLTFASSNKAETEEQIAMEKTRRFLVRYGYELTKRAATLAKEDVPAGKTEAADEFGSAGMVKVAVQSADDVMLRNAGISFSQGFGVAFGSKDQGDATVGTVMARWNWLQRSAAGKWNRWTGENNAEGYAQVPYRGKIEYWNGWRDYSDINLPKRRGGTWPEFTAFGPFLGSGAVGEKVKFGTDTERPYLVGLTLGWGFLDEAASLLYVDVGVTVSPNSGFEHSKFFAGVSMDAIILSKVMGLTRKAKPEGE